MKWWLDNHLRMIQNNIRDIDARMDVGGHVQWLKSLGANALQIGCGGITSFYPTELTYQRPSPFLNGDFFGELAAKCHENGIRVIARFDFSKLGEELLDQYPEWWIRRSDNSVVRYNDTIFTCVNSEYQQVKSSEIIAEVLGRYPIDGVFFNYFGYVNFDYSGKRFGVCQCQNCKRKFREMFGGELPGALPPEGDPRYDLFKKRTVSNILRTIRDTVHSFSADVAISTYATECVDIVRNESNTELSRPLPLWIYASSDNASLIEDSYEDKISSNVSINAISFAYRYSGIDPALNEIRMWQSIAAGSGLDWCILGGFDEYPDQKNFDSVRKVFGHHKRYERYYGHFNRKTKIMVVGDYDLLGFNAEYRGLYRILKEEHLQFTTVDNAVLEEHIPRFDDYDFILLPRVGHVAQAVREALAATKASVVALGASLARDAQAVRSIFHVELGEHEPDTDAVYVRTEPAEWFEPMVRKGTRWVCLPNGYTRLRLMEGTRGALPKVAKALYGPPERAYGHRETDEPTACMAGNGNVYLSWGAAAAYYQYGHADLKRLILGLMQASRPISREIETNAPEMVEIFFSACGGHACMLRVVNLTGFNGVSAFEPLPMETLWVRFTRVKPRKIWDMTERGLVEVPAAERLAFSLKGAYRSFLIEV